MIRRDYILRMIEEFIRAVAGIRALKKRERWGEAENAIDAEFQKLVGMGAQEVSRRSETELLAELAQSDSTRAVREKALLLTTLLAEAGDVASAEGHIEESHARYLKALHLLLYVMGEGEAFDCPEFVPKIELLLSALNGAAVPPGTTATLMRHYERTGEFDKAENALFALHEADPENTGILDFGAAFYQRLRGRRDDELQLGNLPREEVEAGAAEWRARAYFSNK